MSFTIQREGQDLTARLHGELSTRNRTELKAALLEELEQGVRCLRLDMREAEYVDSSGLGLLVTLHKRVAEHGGELRLARPTEAVRQLLTLSKLDTLLAIDDEPDAGVAASRRPSSPSGDDRTHASP